MLRPWVHNLAIRPEGGSLSLRIAQAIIDEIQRGRLVTGDPLPGTRDLARHLNINRKTVVVAYEELAAQGWVKTDSRRGTFVLKSIRDAVADLSISSTVPPPALASGTRMFIPPHPWSRGGKLGFDDGVPDQRLIPADAIARAFGSAARAAVRQRRLGYGDPRGVGPLRQSIAKMLNATRGLAVPTDNVCVTRGSQMALYVIAQSIVAPGDTVVFEDLTYPPAVQAFRLAGARIGAVRMGPDGINLDSLEAICRRQRVRAVYLRPGHQFPTTVVMRPGTRLRLRALARQFGFFIVEDDYDQEFHFDHQPMLPLASNDHGGQVIYVGSFSKVLSPSLRVGYIAAQPALIERFGNCISAIDRQGDPITELAIVEMIESGNLRRHIRKVHGIYKARRAAFAAALTSQLRDLAAFDVPAGGLAFWVWLADVVDSVSLGEHLEQNVLTSRQCRIGDGERFGLRLGFASLDQAEAKLSLQRLAAALDRSRGGPTGEGRALVAGQAP